MVSEKTLTGAAARRAQNRTEMRGAILAEARRMVDEGGFAQLSMRAIARGLGYSPGALYEYFPDREAILRGLYFDGTGGLGDTMQMALDQLPDGTDPRTTVHILGIAYRTYALDHAELYRLTFGALACPPMPDKDDNRPESFGLLVTALQHGVETGVFAGDPLSMAVTCWAAVHGFVSLELSGHLTGADHPGVQPPSPEQGRAVRDALFDQHIHRTSRSLMVDPPPLESAQGD